MRNRIATSLTMCIAGLALACSSSTSDGNVGGSSTSSSQGGASASSGSSAGGSGGSSSSKAASSSGGSNPSGGSSSQSSASGGAGGSSAGGSSSAKAGSQSSGGTTVISGSKSAGGSTTGGSTGGTSSRGGTNASVPATGGAGSSGGTTSTGTTPPATGLPGDVAKAAGTPFVAAHSMTRALFASYSGPLFKALRTSDNKEQDIGVVSAGGLGDFAALATFCAGTTCKVTTLYDQAGNSNDLWRADDSTKNQPGTNRPCNLMDIEYWQMADGTKVPIAVETGGMWKDKSQCLRNRDKTKNMPVGAKPQTTYAVFHAKWLNNNCCFNYGNTGNLVHYAGPGTMSALNFSKIEFWSKGTGSGPWVMVDWEQGVYAGNIAKCGSGAAPTAECTTTGENPNPSITFDVVTALAKHDGTKHWMGKAGNAKSGALAVSFEYQTLPKGYSPLKQEGGLGIGEGGAGDSNGTGGFSEGAVMAAETTDATDDAIQKSIVAVYAGKGAGGTGGSGGSGGTGGQSGSAGTTGGSSASGGSTGTSSSAPSITSVSGSKQLGTLSATEAAQLCTDTSAYYGKTIAKEDLCKWKGLAHGVSTSAPTDDVLRTACASEEGTCSSASASELSCKEIPSACTATVAQYSTCITDKAAAFNTAVKALPGCSTVKMGDLEAVWNFMTGDPPASCAVFDGNGCSSWDLPSAY
jgi:non-reducing end alpha-L-arabinofuranosidase